MAKKTRGDVLRINITPASTTFPFIRLFRHPYGIRRPGREAGMAGAQNGKSRKTVALEIGEEVIKNSKILSAWFRG